MKLFERVQLLTRRRATFITDRELATRERFAQFCAFGTTFTHAVAARSVDWFDRCRVDWSRSEDAARWGELPESEQNVRIDRLLLAIVQDVIDGLDRSLPLTLGISAGFDSRLLLHVFRRLGMVPRTYTIGQPGSLDFVVIRALTERIALDHRFVDTSEMQWDLDEVDRRARARPLTPGRAIVHEAYGLESQRSLVTGYLGGSITGSTIPSVPSPDWPTALRAFCRRNDAFGWQQFMPVEQVRALLPTEPFLAGSALSYDRQLDLGIRQAQRIRPSGGNGSRPVLPYEDPRWIGFWLSRPTDAIGEQALYIRFLRSLRAEEFFDLPLVSAPRRNRLLHERARLLLGSDGRGGTLPVDTGGKVLPRDVETSYCWFAGYANNASFRRLLEQILRRLEGRGVFARSFIAQVRRRFERGESAAAKMLNGLVSVDLALEAGLL